MKTILLIDQPWSVAVMQQLLKQEACEVLVATRLEEVTQRLEQARGRIDLVIAESGVGPAGKGSVVVLRLRIVIPDLKVIWTSQCSWDKWRKQNRDLIDAIPHDSFRFLEKPLSAADFSKAVEDLIGLSAPRGGQAAHS